MKFNDYDSPYAAWSTGFTSALNIVLDANAHIPTSLEEALAYRPDEATTQIDNHELNLWLNVGRHLTHGAWAIAGARQAVYMVLMTLWDHTQLQKPETLPNLFKTIENSDPDFISGMIATEIDGALDEIVTLTYLDATASRMVMGYVQL